MFSVVIGLSDPWELGEQLSWKELDAKVLLGADSDRGGSILLQLDEPFVFRETLCEFFVASPRHEGNRLSSLLTGSSVFCNLTRIPPDRVSAKNPLDVSWWRGGVGCIGTLVHKR